MADRDENTTNAQLTPPQPEKGKKPDPVLTHPALTLSVGVKTGALPDDSNFAIGYRILQRMRSLTPVGAQKPWKTSANVIPIERVLAAGETERSLLDHVDGAAELIRRGDQHARWWTPENLFGAVSGPQWAADVAVLRQAQAAAQEAQRQAVAGEARAAAEAKQVIRAPVLTNLEIQRMAREVLGRMGGRADDDSETG